MSGKMNAAQTLTVNTLLHYCDESGYNVRQLDSDETYQFDLSCQTSPVVFYVSGNAVGIHVLVDYDGYLDTATCYDIDSAEESLADTIIDAVYVRVEEDTPTIRVVV